MHEAQPPYRPDIDGLRAIAILSVVIHHAFPTQLRGGFAGVDIFFVISGFLISSIIFRSLQRDDFSFAAFYARRVRRIFPALLLVLAASYAIGWVVLLPQEFKQLGLHMAAGAGFVQNIVLNNEAGYFDTASELKPLLHLWSLSIEEQFYLVFPVLIWGAWRAGLNALSTMIVLAFLSFSLNLHHIDTNATQVFFMPQTRFWELLAGSALAYIQLFKSEPFARALQRLIFHPLIFSRPFTPERRALVINNLLAACGLLLIVAAVLGLSNNMAYPGKWALLPVLGAFLLILSGPQAWVNRKVLANRLMVFVGLISYPLYLWHWPLLSFARIMVGETPSANIRMALVALSLVLAWLTLRVIEKPMRLSGHQRIKTAALCLLIALVGFVGINAYQREGLAFRSVSKLNDNQDRGDGGNSLADCGIEQEATKKLFGACLKDKRGHVRFALLGDSKAAALYPGLVKTSSDSGRWMFIGGNGSSGAPIPLISNDPELALFQPLINIAIKTIEENKEIDTVIIVTAIRSIFQLNSGTNNGNITIYDYKYLRHLTKTTHYNRTLTAFSEVIARFSNAGKKVILVIDNPVLPSSSDCVARVTSIEFINNNIKKSNPDCFVPLNLFNEQISIYRNLLADLKSRYPKTIEIFDPTEIYCEKSQGFCGPIRDGRPLYSYSDHISDYAAVLVGEKLNEFLLRH